MIYLKSWPDRNCRHMQVVVRFLAGLGLARGFEIPPWIKSGFDFAIVCSSFLIRDWAAVHALHFELHPLPHAFDEHVLVAQAREGVIGLRVIRLLETAAEVHRGERLLQLAGIVVLLGAS